MIIIDLDPLALKLSSNLKFQNSKCNLVNWLWGGNWKYDSKEAFPRCIHYLQMATQCPISLQAIIGNQFTRNRQSHDAIRTNGLSNVTPTGGHSIEAAALMLYSAAQNDAMWFDIVARRTLLKRAPCNKCPMLEWREIEQHHHALQTRTSLLRIANCIEDNFKCRLDE